MNKNNYEKFLSFSGGFQSLLIVFVFADLILFLRITFVDRSSILHQVVWGREFNLVLRWMGEAQSEIQMMVIERLRNWRVELVYDNIRDYVSTIAQQIELTQIPTKIVIFVKHGGHEKKAKFVILIMESRRKNILDLRIWKTTNYVTITRFGLIF